MISHLKKMHEAGDTVSQKGREAVDEVSQKWQEAGNTVPPTGPTFTSKVNTGEPAWISNPKAFYQVSETTNENEAIYENELAAISTAQQEDKILQDAFNATSKKIQNVGPAGSNMGQINIE